MWYSARACARASPPRAQEALIDGFEEEADVEVRLQLLTATVKLFLARPGELQHMLGRLLKAACNDTTDIDVHDRAMMYYRMLEQNVEEVSVAVWQPERCVLRLAGSLLRRRSACSS